MKKKLFIFLLMTLATLPCNADNLDLIELPLTPTAYDRGLDYLASVQNSDGSWGTPAGSIYETSIVILAFLNYGETPASEKYGISIEQGLRWLVVQAPKNDHDQVILLHSLAATHDLTRIPIVGERVNELRKEFNPKGLKDEWSLLYKITKHGDATPADLKANTLALSEFAIDKEKPSPLALYMQTLSVLIHGGKVWDEYNQNTLAPFIETQAEDGTFSLEVSASLIESTAFALLRISSYHFRFWLDYLNMRIPYTSFIRCSPHRNQTDINNE